MNSDIVSAPWPPARQLLLIALTGVMVSLWVTWLALQSPWLGIELKADQKPGLAIVHVDANGSSHALQDARRLLSLSLPESAAPFEIQAGDLTPDPDELSGYAAVDAFIERQHQLAAILRAPSVQLRWVDDQGDAHDSLVSPTTRPLIALPFLFWYEVICALGGLLIAAWVFVLRPGDRAVQFFAITGVCMFVTILVNSLYVNRELAIDGMNTLVTLNHLAIYGFGCALIDLFLCYPSPLVRPRHLVWPWLVYAVWWLLDILQVFPDQLMGTLAAMLSQILIISLLAALQWRRSRRQPLQRAALRLFALSFIVTLWLLVFSITVPVALGYPVLIPIGYAAGFVFLSYIGLALGLSRYRLFDLDAWAYRILLTVMGSVLVVVLDLLLIWGLHLNPWLSLGWALFLAGWIYFPIRQWLWRRMIGRTEVRLEELLPDVIGVAFAASDEGREQRWQQILRRLFAPIEQNIRDGSFNQASIAEDGLSLLLPACAGMSARELRHAGEGKRLFTRADVEFAQGLCNLMTRAANSREAYERGAEEERGRVYRDLHDDIGAKLLSLVIGAENPERADLARSALHDLRDVVSHGGRGAMPLSDLLADWRAEIDGRLSAAGLSLYWHQPDDLPDTLVAPEPAMHISRILRESVSNILRHARASRLTVSIQSQDGDLWIELMDDGQGLPEVMRRPGKGLINMRKRAEQLGGEIEWQATQPKGCLVRLHIALERLSDGALLIRPNEI